ncbi:MAG: hypothetical protein IJT77_09930 [Clostridia bacterium]|nr:hypothetical protein [Clostridia bacterium]
MKNVKSIWMALLAMTLVLCLGVAAIAESATETPATSENTEAAAEAGTTEESTDAADSTKDKALEEALQAYATAKRAARVQEKQDALKSELDAYVEAGTLTQEQADLILNYSAEQQSKKEAARAERKNAEQNGQPNGNTKKGNRKQKGISNPNVNGMNGRNIQKGNGVQRGNGNQRGRGNNMFPNAPVMPQGTSL